MINRLIQFQNKIPSKIVKLNKDLSLKYHGILTQKIKELEVLKGQFFLNIVEQEHNNHNRKVSNLKKAKIRRNYHQLKE